MKFTIQREDLLKPLQQVIGAVERRQTVPILANVLLRVDPTGLFLTATDLEIELVANSGINADIPGETTLPGRKLLDICRALPEKSRIEIEAKDEKAQLKSGRSRFSLACLPAGNFPALEELPDSKTLTIAQVEIKALLERTAFAMAQQDVRYYLNGLLLEIDEGYLRTVATDGHRLSLSDILMETGWSQLQQVIIPRKGVMELERLLESNAEEARIRVSTNHIVVDLPNLRFTSKLIDGRFPDYQRVIPQPGPNTLTVERDDFRQALTRASILSNEKYRGIRLIFNGSALKIQAHNPEQEEAEEELEVSYEGAEMEIGFNVNYLLDVLAVMSSQMIELQLNDASSSAVIRAPDEEHTEYVVMPMRL